MDYSNYVFNKIFQVLSHTFLQTKLFFSYDVNPLDLFCKETKQLYKYLWIKGYKYLVACYLSYNHKILLTLVFSP